jgi:hypothetical protein
MYVKWRKEKLCDRARSTALRAQVVRSYRDPATPTKVRSEFIGYLATIKEEHCLVPIAQEKFWREIDEKLLGLRLVPEDEQHIREKLLAKVPRPRSWSEILAPYAKFAREKIRVR